MRFLLDSDAVIQLRSLGLLETVLLLDDLHCVMTGYAARTEVAGLLEVIERCKVPIHEVVRRTAADRERKRLLRERGVHKGEAEALAWAVMDAIGKWEDDRHLSARPRDFTLAAETLNRRIENLGW